MYEFLTQNAQNILKKEFGVKDAPVTWDRPQEITHGDITTTVCLRLGKELGRKPQELANVLAAQLKGEGIERAEVAGPGYVNLWLTPAMLLKELNATRTACTPLVTRKKEAPVIVEYSQPNIAKPLGVHHILGTVIGQAIANVYGHQGYNVLRWNYIGDWGTQFGKLAVAVEKWGSGKPASEYTVDELLELYVKFHEEAEKDPSLEEAGRSAFRKLEQGDKALRLFWKNVVAVTKEALAGIYERLHVSFDLDLGESFYEDKMEGTLTEGIRKKVFTEGKEGALIVEFPEASNLPPYLVRKGDGATLYSTRDIAQMRYRIDTYHPQEILILTDIAQKLHFEQLVATCGMLGWELPSFENVLFGRMRFKDEKMSTRKGTVLKLEDVLAEAVKRAEAVIAEHGEDIQTDDAEELAEMMGIGALVYSILSQNRKMDLVFDWDKALSFDGNSAPYLQYTHARARSVLRRAEGETPAMPDRVEALAEKERILIGTLLLFEQVLGEARRQHMPHILANYLYKLCQDFNAFYNEEPILKSEGSVRALRLSLTALTADVLKTGAELLTLRVPDRM